MRLNIHAWVFFMAMWPFSEKNIKWYNTLTNQHDYTYSIKLTCDIKCCTVLLQVKTWPLYPINAYNYTEMN